MIQRAYNTVLLGLFLHARCEQQFQASGVL